jgi:hypothetical protein
LQGVVDRPLASKRFGGYWSIGVRHEALPSAEVRCYTCHWDNL